MSTPFTDRLRVRAYECDSFGHVNNATYIQYLQQATFDAIGVLSCADALPKPRTLSIEYHTPARYGDVLDIATWVLGADVERVRCGYKITRRWNVAPIVSAQIEWESLTPITLQEMRNEAPLKPFTLPRDNGARPYRWRHSVRRHEPGMTNQVELGTYFNWIEEAFFHAVRVAGWTLERLRAENFLSLQFRHDAEFFDEAQYPDDIEIVSRLIEVRRVRGTWIHEVYRAADHALLLRDYSTGAFVDWQGNLRTPPPGLMDKIIQTGSRDA